MTNTDTVLSEKYWKCTSISKEKFAEIFKSDSEYEIPMLEERYDVLREAGNKLLKVIRIYKFFFFIRVLFMY
jgi:hypothetical protein